MEWDDVQGRRKGVSFRGITVGVAGGKVQCSLFANAAVHRGIGDRIDTALQRESALCNEGVRKRARRQDF